MIVSGMFAVISVLLVFEAFSQPKSGAFLLAGTAFAAISGLIAVFG